MVICCTIFSILYFSTILYFIYGNLIYYILWPFSIASKLNSMFVSILKFNSMNGHFALLTFFLFVIDHILHLSAYAKVQKECWMKISGIYSNSICVSRSLPLLGPLHWNPLHRRSHIMITENFLWRIWQNIIIIVTMTIWKGEVVTITVIPVSAWLLKHPLFPQSREPSPSNIAIYWPYYCSYFRIFKCLKVIYDKTDNTEAAGTGDYFSFFIF